MYSRCSGSQRASKSVFELLDAIFLIIDVNFSYTKVLRTITGPSREEVFWPEVPVIEEDDKVVSSQRWSPSEEVLPR